jgi:hypothetical protein
MDVELRSEESDVLMAGWWLDGGLASLDERARAAGLPDEGGSAFGAGGGGEAGDFVGAFGAFAFPGCFGEAATVALVAGGADDVHGAARDGGERDDPGEGGEGALLDSIGDLHDADDHDASDDDDELEHGADLDAWAVTCLGLWGFGFWGLEATNWPRI